MTREEFKIRKLDRCLLEMTRKTGRPPSIKGTEMMRNIEKLSEEDVLEVRVKNDREAENLRVHLSRNRDCLTNKNVSFIHKPGSEIAYVFKKRKKHVRIGIGRTEYG